MYEKSRVAIGKYNAAQYGILIGKKALYGYLAYRSGEDEVIGYVDLEYYEPDLNGQKKFIEDLMKLDDKKLYGKLQELNYDLPGFCFKNDDYKEYHRLHGSKYVRAPSDCINFNELVFYAKEVIFLKNKIEKLKRDFNEIDPTGDISVYIRNGRDWYVCHSLEYKEIEIAYLENKTHKKEDKWKFKSFKYLAFIDNDNISKKLDRILSILIETLDLN